jgi:hypothetical protein
MRGFSLKFVSSVSSGVAIERRLRLPVAECIAG